MATNVRWTLVVSREVDLALRTHLAEKGIRKGDLSRFVEDAVRWRVLDRTVESVKTRNQAKSSVTIGREIDAALIAVRTSRKSARKSARHG